MFSCFGNHALSWIDDVITTFPPFNDEFLSAQTFLKSVAMLAELVTGSARDQRGRRPECIAKLGLRPSGQTKHEDHAVERKTNSIIATVVARDNL